MIFIIVFAVVCPYCEATNGDDEFVCWKCGKRI